MEEEALKSEVSEMNDAFESVIKEVSSEPEPEPKVEEEVKDEVIEDKEEKKVDDKLTGDEEEEKGEEEIVDEEKVLGEKEAPAEDERDSTIAELRRKLEEKEAKEEPEKETPAEEPPTFETQEFLTEDEDLDDLVRDPKKLNEVFNNIYQRAVTDTRKVLGEGILRSIPDIVRSSVDMMDRLKEMNTKFYADNQELTPFKKVVAAVFEEVATEHPGKDMMELLPMVADESRKRLELHKQAIKTEPETRKSPRLPSRKRRTTIADDKPNTDPLLNELEEMNKIIRR